MRLVYVSDDDETLGIEPDIAGRWEAYRFHDMWRARDQWRAPVAPYFHVIDPDGRVVAKGVANPPAHLDPLLSLVPGGTSPSVQISYQVRMRDEDTEKGMRRV